MLEVLAGLQSPGPSQNSKSSIFHFVSILLLLDWNHRCPFGKRDNPGRVNQVNHPKYFSTQLKQRTPVTGGSKLRASGLCAPLVRSIEHLRLDGIGAFIRLKYLWGGSPGVSCLGLVQTKTKGQPFSCPAIGGLDSWLVKEVCSQFPVSGASNPEPPIQATNLTCYPTNQKKL